MSITSWLIVMSLGSTTAATAIEDLGKTYNGKLDHVENSLGRDWTATPADVWELKSFGYRLRGKLEIELGPSTVVIGKHTDEKGKHSAVWAALFPHERSAGEPLASSEPGHGNRVESIFMRFHPKVLSDLFPKKTVVGRGDAKWLLWGRRAYSSKINSGWQSENMPVVPVKESIVFDIETVEGPRRYYSVDTKAKSLRYVESFKDRTMSDPPAEPVTEEEALQAFDATWKAFDEEYAMFGVKPHVDWDEVRETYRPIAAAAQTKYEVGGVIGLMTSALEDLHVYVKVDGNWVPGFNRMRMANGDIPTVKKQLTNLHETKFGVTWGEANYEIGYIIVWNLSSDGLDGEFDRALDGLGHTKGLIVDLRFNGGGDELLARRLAGRFLDKTAIYSQSRYRNGPGREDLGPPQPREFEPRGPWRYEAPVVVLQGQKTMSSAESLALMFAQCPDVTTMGDRTAGSSANPRKLEPGLGIVVNLPRWLDLDPAGDPIDFVGIQPDLRVETPNYSYFRGQDPVFDAALKHLKKAKGRQPGRRD